MAEVSTFAELQQAAQAAVQNEDATLTDFTEGSNLSGVIGAAATLAEESQQLAVRLFRQLFFGTAQDEALDTLALDRLDLERPGASAAIGEVAWTRDAGVGSPYDVPEGFIVRGISQGVTVDYEVTTTTAIPVSPVPTLVPVRATSTGRDGNLPAGTVTTIPTPLAADPAATITNPERMAGGAARLTNDEFRAFIRRFESAVGTLGAIESGALTVDGVRVASASEPSVGTVLLYVGDPDAAGNQALADAVDAVMINFRGGGIRVQVLPAAREVPALQIALVIAADSDQPSIEAACRAEIVAYGETIPAGEPAYVSQIEAACHRASALVASATVNTTQTTIQPSAAQNAIRFELGSITFTVTSE